jgi:hypothetical protein
MAESSTEKLEPGRRKTGGMGPWAFCLLSPVLCLLPVACAPDDFGTAGDPLIGGPPVRPPYPAAPSASTASTAGVVPPLPATNPTGTPAALTRDTLDPSRSSPRIGDSAAPAWQGAGGAAVALQAPQPAAGPGAPLQSKPAPEVQLTSNVSAPTYEQLRAQLRARGVAIIKITVDGTSGETSMSCFVPLKGDPTKQQRYDATRARDEVAAMQALLEQIDKGH